MKVFSIKMKDLPKIEEKIVILLGKFDGVHRGHQSLVNIAKEIASKNDAKIGIFTFDPHPLKYLTNLNIEELTTKEEKEDIFRGLNVDYLFRIDFDQDTATMAPNEFLRLLQDNLNIQSVIVGKDYRFGHKGEGNVDLLKKCPFDVLVVDDVVVDEIGKAASSTIRRILRSGNIREANKLLGRTYSLKGNVVHGSQIGRTIDFPTANIQVLGGKIFPDNGVYIVDVLLKNNVYRGIANIGINPTVTDENVIKLEVHLFDFNQNIYGENVEIFFLDRIRSEKKFTALDDLKRQLEKDSKIARDFN